jgi:hypothetical protein
LPSTRAEPFRIAEYPNVMPPPAPNLFSNARLSRSEMPSAGVCPPTKKLGDRLAPLEFR